MFYIRFIVCECVVGMIDILLDIQKYESHLHRSISGNIIEWE